MSRRRKVVTDWRMPVPPDMLEFLFWQAAGPLIAGDDPSAVLLAGTTPRPACGASPPDAGPGLEGHPCSPQEAARDAFPVISVKRFQDDTHPERCRDLSERAECRVDVTG